MFVTALLAVLLSHLGSGICLQDVAPEDLIKEAIGDINNYNSDNKYQNLQFKDHKIDSTFYDFTTSNVQLGDLSTIQLAPQTKPSIRTMVSDTGTTKYYNATLQLEKGYAQYDYFLKFWIFFWSSGTVTATSRHSFQVEGAVKIDSLKHCQAEVSAISVKLGPLQTTIAPYGLIHFIISPFIRYLTNMYSQDLLPLDTQIADYIQNSIPKSKFSEIVCNVFNK